MTPYGSLEDKFGLVIGGQDLARVLGFRSAQAFKTACSRGKSPIPVFELPGRKGKFAKTCDVVRWYEALPGATGTNLTQR
jgi:hypothetical protein